MTDSLKRQTQSFLKRFDHPLLSPTGRVKSFLEDPDKGVLPASCTMIRLKDTGFQSYKDLFVFVQKALVTGAGVSVHLSNFVPSSPAQGRIVDHPDKADSIIVVQDSMNYDPTLKGTYGIIDTSGYLYALLMVGKNVYLDLSNIRSEGSMGSKGQVASGPKSFMEVYKAVEIFAQSQTITSLLSLLSKFNQTIRRGGVYKNGAVVVSLPIWHEGFNEYANTHAPKDHPFLFKAAIIPENWQEYLDQILTCLEKVNQKDLWLEKCVSNLDNVTWLKTPPKDSTTDVDPFNYILPDFSNTLGHNVCKEVLLDSNGTCIIMPLNLGMAVEPWDIVEGAVRAMRLLCEFQKQDYQSAANIYLSAKEDRQVGLGMMGLANLLAHQNISYRDFTETLEAYLEGFKSLGVTLGGDSTLQDYEWDVLLDSVEPQDSHIREWVEAVILSYYEAAIVAEEYGMYRAFAIAPTASVAFRYKDAYGYAVCPEYSPPLGRTKERLSSNDTGLLGVYQYPPNVEVASQVDRDIHFRLTVALQTLMDMTGLGHAISWNVWDELDQDYLVKFLESPLKSTYYLWERDQSFLDKSDQVQSLSSCGVPIHQK